MPTYSHLCKKCQHEWDDEYKMSEPVPDTCPSCKEVGGVKRLISAATPGKVELYGKELAAHLYAEGKKLARSSKESTIANLVGEERFHQNELNRSRK